MSEIETHGITLSDGRIGRIRTADPSDAERVFAITKAVIAEDAYIVTTPREYDSNVATEAEWINAHFDNTNMLMLVAEVEDVVVGFLNAQAGQRQRLAHRAHFHMLIDKVCRGQGVGTALIQAMLSWAEDHPRIEKMSFSVFSNNARAIAIYTKFGFVEEGRKVKEIRLGPEEYVDEILMYRWV